MSEIGQKGRGGITGSKSKSIQYSFSFLEVDLVEGAIFWSLVRDSGVKVLLGRLLELVYRCLEKQALGKQLRWE